MPSRLTAPAGPAAFELRTPGIVCLPVSSVLNGREELPRTLLSAESFSGWGVRTVATSEARYNPMGYHTGSIWPTTTR